MSYKTVLLQLDDGKACGERTQVAINLAQAFDAHLIGFYSVDPYPIPRYLRGLGDAYEVWRKRLLRENREKAEAAFRERIAQARLRAEWRCAEDDVLPAFQMQARYADLIIVGQSNPEPGGRCVPADFPELLCLSVGRPVMVIPYAGTFRTIGERVLVAWNASREATRAVADALPFLTRATHVTVLAINPQKGGTEHGDVPGADVAWYLARHGVKAEATQTYSGEVDAGNLLLSRAADYSADLLVMGAYGHSRVKEMVLGGVTRTILHDMTLPVLMAH
jgi:nucleotide-binding universal stress UspA family protein